jgi:hypothetical protein
MNEQVLQEIEHRLNRAGKFVLTRTEKPGNLVIEEPPSAPFYSNPDDCKQVTILEALVLGQDATGDMLADAARSLSQDSGHEVSVEVLAAFLQGIEYKHGFLNRK